jgi:hypothetical protein
MVLIPGETIGSYLCEEIMSCTETARNSTGNAINDALQQFIWETGNVDWLKFNITKKEKHFINSLIGTVMI